MQRSSFRAGVARRALILVFASTLLVAGLTGTRPAAAEFDPGGEAALERLINGERAARGAATLRVCADLRDVARRWSTGMATDGALTHNPGMATSIRGWRSLGEIVGYDRTVEDVHQRFMSSPPHGAHVLSSAYTEVGIGVERHADRMWVTAVFRESDGSAPCTMVPTAASITSACPSASVPQAPFRDLSGNAHRGAITCTYWYGLTLGTSPGEFSPSALLTRGQMASFLARMAEQSGLRLPTPGNQGFTDISGNPHADAINQLAALGIVQGLSATTYGPNVLVTRAQLAAALVPTYERITGMSLAASRDWFTDDGGHTHEHAINQAADASFVTGLTDTTFGPDRELRRDQLASFLARTLDRLVAGGHLAPPT